MEANNRSLTVAGIRDHSSAGSFDCIQIKLISFKVCDIISAKKKVTWFIRHLLKFICRFKILVKLGPDPKIPYIN